MTLHKPKEATKFATPNANDKRLYIMTERHFRYLIEEINFSLHFIHILHNKIWTNSTNSTIPINLHLTCSRLTDCMVYLCSRLKNLGHEDATLMQMSRAHFHTKENQPFHSYNQPKNLSRSTCTLNFCPKII